jgi:hypothetical protein
MMDRTCVECERLWQEYDVAAQAELLIKRRSATWTGLEVLVRNASNRCQQARSALLDHTAMHRYRSVTATASATG